MTDTPTIDGGPRPGPQDVTEPDPDCVYCRIATGEEQATIVEENNLTMIVQARTPTRPGHLLVIPRFHLIRVTMYPRLAGNCLEAAAWYARRNEIDLDIETRVGGPHHFAMHLFPRETTSG